MAISLHVECYSGYKAEERPLRFRSRNKDSRTLEVAEVVDQWYGPGYRCFKVLADDGNAYILRHNDDADEWVLDSFRRTSP